VSNKALFLKNSFNGSLADQQAYRYGNSFGVVFDDVKTVNFFGEIKADLSKNVSLASTGALARMIPSLKTSHGNFACNTTRPTSTLKSPKNGLPEPTCFLLAKEKTDSCVWIC
jgi:hypothetical protein